MHVRDAQIAPPSMHDEQLRQKAELTKGVVGGHGCLGAFEAEESTADVGFLDHGDIVCAVTDGESECVAAFFDLR